MVFRGRRQLSKAAVTPPGAAETAPEKQEGFPRKQALLKSHFNAPRSQRDGSGETRRLSAGAGSSQNPDKRRERTEGGERGRREEKRKREEREEQRGEGERGERGKRGRG